MDAAMVTAIAALIGGPVAALGVMYGSRGANRAAQQTSAATMYDSLTQRLVAERDKAEMDEKAAEARASAAEAKVHALEAEVSRLQALVTRLGGAP
ncbi:hypothetical protein [Streptomyces capitiformicae]|uniref:Uncharacterized protein n=1 Tax=Streptomyces capitiformicae TaxID=2014920 RepID=A0A919L7I8_9ACTN|nr:hypothetical protein [Streptomyces capitiformicae]GHH87790.1 hypothetical protein GCM10017771_30350 [Streptomyces capitiformicae]